MAYRCQICGKKRQVGRTGRHKPGIAGKQWKKRAPKTRRVFKPNLQMATIGGKKMRVCTKCLKKVKSQKSKGVGTQGEALRG